VWETASLTVHLFAFPYLKNHPNEMSLALNSVLNLFCQLYWQRILSLCLLRTYRTNVTVVLTVLSSICTNMSMSTSRVRHLVAPMHIGLYKPALCAPCPIKGAPKHFWSSRWPPRLILWVSLGSKMKEPRCACLSEARASHLQRIWAEVFSHHPTFPTQWSVLQSQ
jgi:hypothetical protein